MPLADDIRALSGRILTSLDEARDYYDHTRQAWRLVQQISREGRPVGIVDTTTNAEVPAHDLESRAQRYVTLHLPESVFKTLSALLEDWLLSLIRLWYTHHPEDLDPQYNKATGKTKNKDERKIPLSHVLALHDRDAILSSVIERVVRDLGHDRPEKWFNRIDSRLRLGCPTDAERRTFFEMKAARNILEHNRGVINQEYVDKAGASARYAVGDLVQLDEPYLRQSLTTVRSIIIAMADAAILKTSGTAPGRL